MVRWRRPLVLAMTFLTNRKIVCGIMYVRMEYVLPTWFGSLVGVFVIIYITDFRMDVFCTDWGCLYHFPQFV